MDGEGPARVTRWGSIVLAVLLVPIGWGLHFTDLEFIPGINGDEAQYGALAMARGDDPATTREYFGPYFVRMVEWSIRLLGATPTALRLPSALAAAVVPAVAALALARGAGLIAGATFGLLLLVHPALLVFGRLGWDASLLPASVVLLLLTLRAWCAPPHRPAYLVAAALLAGLCVSFHPTGWLAMPAAAVAAVAGFMELARARGRAGAPPRAALRVGLVAGGAAFAVFLVAARGVLPALPRLLGLGDEGIRALSAARPPTDLAELVTGGVAIRWITGEPPLPPALATILAALTLLLSGVGLALGLLSKRGGERGAALFATLHLAVGFAAIPRTDLAPPGNVRYAVALFPSLLYGAARAPDLVKEALAGRRSSRAAGIAARVGVAALVLAGLWAWRASYWRPLHDAATAAENTFVPGPRTDAKLAAIRAIGARQREDGEPRAAIVARDWNLFHSARYFSERRLPVLRIDAFTPEEFVPRLQSLFTDRDRLYVLVFERFAGEEEALVHYLAARLSGAAVVGRDTIPDLRGKNIVSTYRIERGPSGGGLPANAQSSGG